MSWSVHRFRAVFVSSLVLSVGVAVSQRPPAIKRDPDTSKTAAGKRDSSESDPPNWTAVVGAVTGPLALLLSGYVAWVQSQDKKVDVRASQGYSLSEDVYGVTGYLDLRAKNFGSIPVMLSNFGLVLQDGRTLVTTVPNLYDTSTPFELKGGTGFTYGWQMARLATSLRGEGFQGEIELTVKFTDQLDRVFLSRTFKFDTNYTDPER